MVYSSSGTTASRLAIGTSGQYMTVSGGIPAWTTFSGLNNPMTTVGDIIVGGSSGTPTRLAQGSNGQFLGVSGGTLAYYTPSGSSGANPTGTVGLSAVNGSATTFLRSDGAPALSQSIVPTWTGQHTFNYNGPGILMTATGSTIYVKQTQSGNSWATGMGLSLSGQAYEIYSFSFGDALTFAYSTGNAIFYSTTASTNVTTGGATFAGGVGIAGQMSSGNLLVANGANVATIQGQLSVGGTAFSYGSPSTTGGTAIVVPATTYTVTGASTTANMQATYFGIPTFTDASAGTISAAATVTIGGSPLSAGALTISQGFSLYTLSAIAVSVNTSGGPPGLTGEGGILIADFVGVDGANTRTFFDGFGGNTTVGFRRADNTNASKSAVVSGDNIGAFTWYGYTSSSAYSNGPVGLDAVLATQNFTGSATGTCMLIDLIPNNTTTLTSAIEIYGDQDLVVGAATLTSDPGGTGNLAVAGKMLTYNSIATAGLGVPAVYGSGRQTAQTGADSSVATYTVGAADGFFEVSAYVNVTAATNANFTVTCTYTDEGGTSRTLTFGFTQLSGATFLTAITNVTGVGPYESPVYRIHCKASTTITIASAAGGTYTSVTYNIEGTIVQVG
jgi:hypothetical protein